MNEQNPAHGNVEPRRGFFASFLSVIIGGAISIAPVVTGIVFFFDPILRKKKAAGGETVEGSPGEGYLKVTNESAIPPDGTPLFQEIRKDVVDAWTTYKDQPVGSVYLERKEDGSIQCFNTECPHLGCTVSSVVLDEGEPGFKCPCHDSTFSKDGKQLNDIPPRPMDQLDVQVGENGDVWVKFQTFKIGVKEQIPQG